MAKVIFTAGAHEGEEVDLADAGLVLGRASDAGFVLEDPEISGHHARIARADGNWTIEDMGSSNGTSVNGTPVKVKTLGPGDVVKLGDTCFTIEGDGAHPGSNSSPGNAATTAGTSDEDVRLVRTMSEKTEAIRKEVGKVIVGQRKVLDQVLMCLIAGGHGLIVGLPGMAKTLMVRTISQALDLSFKRIQFTPDLMPSDITGTEVLEMNKATGEKEFRFIHGPVFCNLLLADEINRTPPKTQAALLEAMQEKRVTVGNDTYPLDEPFFVLATQNPIEQEGTYPLPEAQLDRFMFNIWIDYPEEHEEEEIVGTTTVGDPARADRVLSRDDVLQLQEVVRKIPVSPHVVKYVIRLVRATRPVYDDSPKLTREYVSTGAGPRAGQYLVLAAKARAVLEGRIHVSCNDIRHAAIPVLRHRILTNFAADSDGLTSTDIVRRLLESVQEPGEEAYGSGAQFSRATVTHHKPELS